MLLTGYCNPYQARACIFDFLHTWLHMEVDSAEPATVHGKTFEQVVAYERAAVGTYYTTVGSLKQMLQDIVNKLSSDDTWAYRHELDILRRNIHGFGPDTTKLTSNQIYRVKLDMTMCEIVPKVPKVPFSVSSATTCINTLDNLIRAITSAVTGDVSTCVRLYYNNIMFAGENVPDSIHECLQWHGYDWNGLYFRMLLDKDALVADLTAISLSESLDKQDEPNDNTVATAGSCLVATRMHPGIADERQKLFRDIVNEMSTVLSSNGYISGLSNIIETYYRMQDNNEIYGPMVVKLNSIFAKHSWAWERNGNTVTKSGFQKAPDVMFLLSDIQEIVDAIA